MDDARGKLRWEAVDRPQAQTRLLPQRRISHPEFADTEFIHVDAKRIINSLPPASRMPFRHTINAYRGCTHACTYCVSGDTPVLMANGRTRAISDLRVGDAVYGTVREGRYRRYVTTRVLDHWETWKPAYRVTLADGTAIVASGDHQFLTERGWKHVIGTGAGRGQRPHLTTNNSLLGTGAFAEPPKRSEDYRRGYLTGIIRGDGHIGRYIYDYPSRPNMRIRLFRLALADLEALDRARDFLATYGLHFDPYLFQAETPTTRPIYALRGASEAVVDAIERLVAWPETPSQGWRKGFLAGIFDAEGSRHEHILRISNTDPTILAVIAECMRVFGFDVVVEAPKDERCPTVRLRGGLAEHLRFFHLTDPAITRKRVLDGVALKCARDLRVAAVERLGVTIRMFDITTGTGDFIANGVVSHNCFARPTHEYLDLDSGRDFERVIVVKVNAVERLRAELDPRRWSGEHIAMGTNTDPYQRAEGRYRLTRGLIETLTEASNPFSILTKSSLVLRDAELLAEANARADVAVNFSIGTLEDDVWRATEPGAPQPRSRVEAIAALRKHGIAAGVLVAPIIPGISDGPEQLDEVVRACIEAGARSVSPIVLHLRPGVREYFLPWLEEHRPDLAERYQRLYPRAYAPKAEQRRIADLVHGLVRRHGGVRATPRAARRVPPPPPTAAAPPAAAVEQLRLLP